MASSARGMAMPSNCALAGEAFWYQTAVEATRQSVASVALGFNSALLTALGL